MKVTVEVPASIGNVGPGFDVLGLAVDGLCDTVIMERIDGPTVIDAVKGRDAELIPRDPEQNAVTIAAAALALAIGVKAHARVTIARAIPASGGLGASAAASLAGAIGMAAIVGRKATDEQLLTAALVAEATVAGRHLDNIAPSFFGGLTIALGTDPPYAVRVPVAADWWLALVTPAFKLATKQARSVLPDSLPRGEWVRQMALSAGVVAAFRDGDAALLRATLHDPFAEPRRAPLIPGFAAVKAAALACGAMGASISGAGPTVFAVFEDENRARKGAEAMRAAFGQGATMHVGGIAREGARSKIIA